MQTESLDDTDFEEEGGGEGDFKDGIKDPVEDVFRSEFVPVARALLDRVVYHCSEFESLTDEEPEVE